jgi:hypothetical protein
MHLAFLLQRPVSGGMVPRTELLHIYACSVRVSSRERLSSVVVQFSMLGVLQILVVFQAALTVIGNFTMWIAAFRIYQSSQKQSKSS